MDEETRQRRQREFTIYLVLFILLVIVGKITTNGQLIESGPSYYSGNHGNPYGSGMYANQVYGYPFYNNNQTRVTMNAYGGYEAEWPQMNAFGPGPPMNYGTRNRFYEESYGYVPPHYQQPVYGWNNPMTPFNHQAYGYTYHDPQHFARDPWGGYPPTSPWYRETAYQMSNNYQNPYNNGFYQNGYPVNPYQGYPVNPGYQNHLYADPYAMNPYNNYYNDPYAFNQNPYQAFVSYGQQAYTQPDWSYAQAAQPFGGPMMHPYQENGWSHSYNVYNNPMPQAWW